MNWVLLSTAKQFPFMPFRNCRQAGKVEVTSMARLEQLLAVSQAGKGEVGHNGKGPLAHGCWSYDGRLAAALAGCLVDTGWPATRWLCTHAVLSVILRTSAPPTCNPSSGAQVAPAARGLPWLALLRCSRACPRPACV